MSNDRAVPSSDLERARALSIRLTRARTSAPGSELMGAPPAYARFSEPEARPPRACPAPQLNFRGLEAAGSSSWHEFLDWTLTVTCARGAFVVDQDGLTVAFRGGIDAPYLEAVGGRLCLAFDQAAHMRSEASRSEAILIELDGEWLNGVRIPLDLGGRLLLGLLTPKPLDVNILHDVVAALEAAFAH